MKYIKIFQIVKSLKGSIWNTYSEDQVMHTFLYNFHRSGKYSAQIASHQAKLRREGNSIDQKYLSISYLHTDYLNLYKNSVFRRNSEIANLFRQSALFVEVIITLQKIKSVLDGTNPCGSGVKTGHKNKYPVGILRCA